MYEYEQIKRPTGYVARGIAISLFLVAAAAVVTSLTRQAYRSLFQLAAMLCLTAAAFLTVSFVLRTYLFRTELRESGEYDLVIVQLRGNRRTVNVRLSLTRQATGFSDDPAEVRRARSDPSLKRYVYCNDLCPQDLSVLLARDGDEEIAVFFQPDGRMKQVIRSLTGGNQKEV